MLAVFANDLGPNFCFSTLFKITEYFSLLKSQNIFLSSLRPSLRAAAIPAWAATTSHSAAVIPAAATSHSPSSSASRRRFTSPTNNYKRPVIIASSLASSLVHYHHCHMSSSSPCKLCYFIIKTGVVFAFRHVREKCALPRDMFCESAARPAPITSLFCHHVVSHSLSLL